MHKLDKAEFEERQAKGKAAKDELKKDHTPATSVKALRDRVDEIEKAIGI